MFFLFAVLALVFSCNTSNKTATDNPTPKDVLVQDKPDNIITDLDDNPLFYLHRESCRGPCPGYTYTIYQSGKVDYFGQRNVDRVGNHIAELDQTTLTTLKKLANDIGCKKMKDTYADPNIADIPRWTLKYEEKSIKFMEHLAPEDLKNFCKKMDDTLDTLKWENVD